MMTGIAMNVIHHIEDIENALREISRVLKPGGKFYTANLTHGAYDLLPDFIVLRWLGLLTERYRNWRLTRANNADATAYVRRGAYPNGLNMLSVEEWRHVAAKVGLEVFLVAPYSRKFLATLMLDLRYMGLEVPERLSGAVRREVIKIAQEDVASPPAFGDAFSVLLGFRKP